jgi:hypothetical protein
LVWTNDHVQEWVCQIGLEDHAWHLSESGIHGGVIALDNEVDHERLSLALQMPLSTFEVWVRISVRILSADVLHYRVNTYIRAFLVVNSI